VPNAICPIRGSTLDGPEPHHHSDSELTDSMLNRAGATRRGIGAIEWISEREAGSPGALAPSSRDIVLGKVLGESKGL